MTNREIIECEQCANYPVLNYPVPNYPVQNYPDPTPSTHVLNSTITVLIRGVGNIKLRGYWGRGLEGRGWRGGCGRRAERKAKSDRTWDTRVLSSTITV